MVDAVELTRALIRFDTVNPPGNERPCAEYLGALLEAAGFAISYYPMGENRANLVARIGGTEGKKPLCFSGHTDVVPLGAAPWTKAPFAAGIADGKIYGRGASDMKSGVAAFVAAALELAPYLGPTPGLVLVITADEERGCVGAKHLATLDGALGEAGALIVAEPTANRPLVGHKGVLRVEGVAKGITAHSSMPEEGDNAIYKAARAIAKLARIELHQSRRRYRRSRVKLMHTRVPVGRDQTSIAAQVPIGRDQTSIAAQVHGGRALQGGLPTLNVGWFHGGININSVPDEAKFALDIRTVPGFGDDEAMALLAEIGGGEVTFTKIYSGAAVWSDPSDPWIASVFAVMASITGVQHEPAIAPYFTDASPLSQAYGRPPTLILGPGEPELAHQTDEYCLVARVEEGTAAFTEIARAWCGL